MMNFFGWNIRVSTSKMNIRGMYLQPEIRSQTWNKLKASPSIFTISSIRQHEHLFLKTSLKWTKTTFRQRSKLSINAFVYCLGKPHAHKTLLL